MDVEPTYIYFSGLTNDSSNYKLIINMTESNKNYSASDLPYYSNGIIKTNVTGNITGTILISNGACSGLTKITYNTSYGSSTSYDGKDAIALCSAGVITIPGITISQGSNLLVLSQSYNPAVICKGFFDGGMSYGGFIVILIIVACAGVIITMLVGNESGADMDGLIMIAGMIIVGAFVLGIGMSIVNAMSGCA